MTTYKEIVKKIAVSAEMKTKQKEYETTGKLPIIDQGQSLIGGYTNDMSKKISCDLPVIVFGDHTKNVKYINFPFGAGADGIKILQPKANILPKYLYYVTKYLTYRIVDKGYARHYQYIEKEELNVPPLSEQKKIVAHIEELFSKLDHAVEGLQKTKQQLTVYRQAVLKEAFNSVGNNVKVMKIGEVCDDIKVGIVIKPSQYYTESAEGIRAFRSANVREFHIENSEWVYLTKDGHAKNKRSEIHANDVLIVRSGYPGTACIVPKEYAGCNAIDILIAVPNQNLVTSEYLCAFTNSPEGRKSVREKKRGVAQTHLNVGGYSKIKIPVPEIKVQQRIVADIDAQLSIYNSIEQTVDTALTQAEALRQSILKDAFEGRRT